MNSAGSVRTLNADAQRHKTPWTTVLPWIEPEVAVTVTCPLSETTISPPVGVTVASNAGETVHVTELVMFAVLPSE
jgi:hypothetical protein